MARLNVYVNLSGARSGADPVCIAAKITFMDPSRTAGAGIICAHPPRPEHAAIHLAGFGCEDDSEPIAPAHAGEDVRAIAKPGKRVMSDRRPRTDSQERVGAIETSHGCGRTRAVAFGSGQRHWNARRLGGGRRPQAGSGQADQNALHRRASIKRTSAHIPGGNEGARR
jgi:hypothetical protein